ncbi:MAG: 50S ribosomal protein L11 methyltransferase [Thermodesulfobacteriota bacterium]
MIERKRWLSVTLWIPKEFTEGISNLLFEQGASGIEELEEDLNWKRIRSYLPQDGSEKKVLRSLRGYFKSLQNLHPELPQIKMDVLSIPEEDWGESWKRFFKPVHVPPRFLIKPPWSKVQPQDGQIALSIHPKMAFGTGTHPTTKLCLQALEKAIKKKTLSVLDVGTGSGILSIAAAKLGAKKVLGLDIDRVAINNARENVKENRVSDVVQLRLGRIGRVQGRYDVIVANIDFKNLVRMKKTILKHLKRSGILILSGLLNGERDRILEHYWKTGHFNWNKSLQEGEWVCLIFKGKN